MAKLKWCPARHGTYCIVGEVCTEFDGSWLVDEKEIKDEKGVNLFSFCPYCGKRLDRE